MRVFVTGATGFVGSAIVQDLLQAGHQVLGLTRSDAGAQALIAAGAQAHRGSLEQLETVRSGAAQADAVVHAAFNHDFTHFAANCEADRCAIEAMGEALAGTDRPLIVTASLPHSLGRPATEDDALPEGAGASPRVSEQTALTQRGRGVRVSVVRMSQVHNHSRQGLATYMVELARKTGVSAYVGTGSNRWSAVHRRDAASLYRLALEHSTAGAIYHAVAEEGISVRDIAQAIGQALDLPSVELAAEEAASHFGWLGFPVCMETTASSALTQQRLGWHAADTTGFLANLRQIKWQLAAL